MATHYHAGHNIPGYLPESDVAKFDTFEEAKAYQIYELDRAGDHMFECYPGQADEYSAVMEDLNLLNGPEWSDTLPTSDSPHDLGIVYWINQCNETEGQCDDDCLDDEDN